MFKAEKPSLEVDESRIGHAVHSQRKATAAPPTHFLSHIENSWKLELLVIFPCLPGRGGCIIESKQSTHY